MATDTTDASAAYYVFNIEADGGFVIVSGDDQAPAILGYTDHGTFAPGNLPPNMQAWLDVYEEQLSCIGTDDTLFTSRSSQKRTPSVRRSVAPLLTTTWNQNDPYNRQLLDATKYKDVCFTGCVATAMAQLLNYHAQLTGQPRYTTSDIPSYTTMTRHYEVEGVTAGTYIDWAHMRDSYEAGQTALFGEQQASLNAVAQLMHICGASVGMNYGTDTSGANSWDVPQTLRTFFGYDKATRMADRYDYTISQWNELIYGELIQRRPVYFSGASSGGGHAFIVDGFDGDGMYHINWGWGGHCDGYYVLALANPTDKEGIGAGNSDDGYAMRQGAIIGAQPDTGRDPGNIDPPQPATGKNYSLKIKDFVYKGTRRAEQLQKAEGTIVNTGDEFYGNIHFITKKIGIIFKDTCSVGAALLPGQEQKVMFDFKPSEAGRYSVTITTDISSIGVIFSDTIDILPEIVTSKDVNLNIVMEITNLDSSGKGILGNKAHLRTTITNPTATAYEGLFVPLLASSAGTSFSVKRELFDAYTTTVLDKEFDVYPGYSYLPMCVTEIPGRQQIYQSPKRYYPVSPAVTVFFADGTRHTYEATTETYIPASAVAVNLVGNDITQRVVPSSNPNCIYYLSAEADTPSGLQTNVVKGKYADRLVLSESTLPFMPIADFTAADVTYTRRFDRGTVITGSGNSTVVTPVWTTICLPFSVDRCLLHNGQEVNWERQDTGNTADFWLMEFWGDEHDTLFFRPAQAMQAYTPYLLSVPAAGVKGKADMTTGPVTFCGHNATIRAMATSVAASTSYKFVGTMKPLTDSEGAYVIDTDGRQCRRQTVSTPPFQAYVKATGNTITADMVPMSIRADFMDIYHAGRYGDVNGDGFVNVADIAAVIDFMADGDISRFSREKADVNGDGKVDVADISALIELMAQPAE